MTRQHSSRNQADGIGRGQPCDTFVVETQQHLDRGYTALQCDQCGATWVGPNGESCDWCQTALEHMRQWQAELVLTAPDCDPQDQRHPDAMIAWQERLANAIRAGIITKHDASRVWKRAVG